jgi:hypothetical protein
MEQLAVLRKLKQQAAAALLGWTPRGLRDANAPRRDDGTYDAIALVAWMLERAAGKSEASPADKLLEDLRREKAREAKRRNDLAEGRLVELARVQAEASAIGTVLRVRSEAIERAFGAEVGKAVREMIDEMGRALRERVLGERPCPPKAANAG